MARPLFFEFREDVTTWDIDRQFLIGSGLLISPVLEAGTSTVRAYFPAGKWYDFFTLAAIEGADRTPTWLNLHTPLDKINVRRLASLQPDRTHHRTLNDATLHTRN